MALLRKYKNPFRILYLWAVQETLEVKALVEAFKIRDEIMERRKKMMKKMKMSEDDVTAIRHSSIHASLLEESKENLEKQSSAVETQIEILELMKLYEMVTRFQACLFLPRFKKERIATYKKILAQFSKMERLNSKNIIMMWQSIMNFHSQKAVSNEYTSQASQLV